MRFRLATPADADVLAPLNALLRRDEGHRNRMTLPELTERMRNWLKSEYQAVLIEDADGVIGYALFRRDPECIYLRQLFLRLSHGAVELVVAQSIGFAITSGATMLVFELMCSWAMHWANRSGERLDSASTALHWSRIRTMPPNPAVNADAPSTGLQLRVASVAAR